MKNLFLAFLLLSCNYSYSQNYFWVGNEGNWSDLSHWAKSSGGSDFYTVLPDSTDNIIFDSNSFTTTSQTVFLDFDGAQCNDLSLVGVSFKPTFQASDYFNELHIHGSLKMTSELTWGIVQNYLLGNEESDIHIDQAFMGGFLIINPRDSSASFNLKGDFEGQQIEVLNGQFRTQGYDLNIGELRLGSFTSSGSPYALLSDSNLKTSRFLAFETSRIDADSCEITIFDGPGPGTNLFFGGGHSYYHVNFEGEIDRIKDNNQYVLFKALPGSSLSLEGGEVQKAENFVFEGKASAPINLKSRTEGLQAILEQDSGFVNGNYLIVKDNQSRGGAIFNAFNSIDNGNVSGWNIETTKPEDYYWVNDSGNWSDLSHWARSSGGNDFHIEVPSAIDNVIFDENSVNIDGARIDIDLEAISINNFTSLGLKSGSEINSQGGKISIYGDVSFGEGLNLFFSDVEFLSDSIQTLTSNGSSWGIGSKLEFTSSSRIILADNISTDDLSISNGEFSANGNDIKCFGDLKLSTLNDPKINFDDCHISVRSWIPSSDKIDLSMKGTSLTCGFIFYGEGFEYENLTFIGRNWVYGPFYSNNLEFTPGSEILIFPGDTVKFDKLTAIGNETDSISIRSREEGQHAYLYSENGEVQGEYLILKDNRAIGGANFIAVKSKIDESSVLGWNGLSSSLEDFEPSIYNIYPNPADDLIYMDCQNGNCGDLLIYNLNGERMSLMKAQYDGNRLKINTSGWPSGIYFTKAHHSSIVQKIMIQRAIH